MKLGNKITNPGELNKRVLAQNPVLVTGASGAQLDAWFDVLMPWVRWTNAHGQEGVSSEALKAVKRATVLMRYHPDISERSSFVKDGERWQVVSMDDIQERHEYLELIVECAKGSV